MKKLLLLACVAAIACGDDDVVTMDGGMADGGMPDVITIPDTGPGPDTGPTPDSGPTPDTGPAPTNLCDPGALENVAADLNAVVSTIIDTSATTWEPQALESCGNELTGQLVVAITVPGAEANQVIQVSTENDGTEDFDTILDLRTECATEGVCFDDTAESLRSTGTIIADGGSTVFALVSGFGEGDQGIVEVTVEVLGTAGGVGDPCDETVCAPGLVCNATSVCETAEPPVLTAAEVVRYDNVGADMDTELAIGVIGTDANADVVSFNFTFLDAAGDDFDFADSGEPTLNIGIPEIADLAMFAEAAIRTASATADYPAEAVGFRISLIDSAGLESNEITGDITTGTPAAAGESCEYTSRCAEMLICGLTDLCEAPVAPVITSATTVRYDDADFDGTVLTILGLGLNADDANGDVVAFNFALLDASDEVVEIADLSPAAFTFDEVTGLGTFMEAAFLSGGETSMFPPAAVRFRLSLIDSAELVSNVITGDITAGTLSAAGEACAFTAFCDPAEMLICNDADMCEAP